MPVEEMSIAFHISPKMIQKVYTQYAVYSLESCIERKKRSTPPVPAKGIVDIESHIIPLACMKLPEGDSGLTVRFLAYMCVKPGFI